MAIVDPYRYRDRFADLPKYEINASGDSFFLPDSAQFYFGDLPGPKHLRYMPNTDHGLGSYTDVILSLIPYYEAVVAGTPVPVFSWDLPPDGSIRVQTVDVPLEVNLWQEGMRLRRLTRNLS